MNRRLLVLVLGLVGCGSSAIPTAEPPEGRIAIYTADPSGAPLAVPFVDVRLADQSERLMLDTGASQHFLLGATAWVHDVGSEPLDFEGTDAHGRDFSARLAQAGMVRVDRYVAPYVFVFESPQLYDLGIRGGLSPQLLAGTGRATVVDVREGFLEVRSIDALRGWERRLDARACVAGDDPRDGFRFILPVRIGDVEAPLMIDTGAEGVVVYAGTPAAAPLEARIRELQVRAEVADAVGPPDETAPDETAPGRTGADEIVPEGSDRIEEVRIAGAASVASARVLPNVPVTLGGARLSSSVGVIDYDAGGSDECGELGVVGFRVLRHCVLVLRREGAAVRCDARPPPMRRALAAEAPSPVRVLGVEATAGCGYEAPELTPTVDDGGIPEMGSAIEAYARLQPSIDAHAERIERACREAGYLEARVRRPLLRRTPDGLRVRFEVEEGRRRRVRRFAIVVEVSGGETHRFDASEVAWLRTRPGVLYVERDFEADDDDLREALDGLGYAVHGSSSTLERVGDDALDLELSYRLDPLEGHRPVALPGARPDR
jgi:hypothetical protein